MAMYTGIRVIKVSKDVIEYLSQNKEIDILDEKIGLDAWGEKANFSQNEYLVLKDESGEIKSILARVKGDKVYLLKNNLKASNISPKNKEQVCALDALLDDSVGVVVLSGRAGSGKTLLSLAAAIQKVEEGKYKKIIMSRPQSQVGKYDLGTLPGEVKNKIFPYLQGYSCNLDLLIGEHKDNLETFIEQYRADFVPVQLMRGASFMKSFVIIDESQILDEHEILTIGSRIVDGSKLVILGDLRQRDEKIAVEKTGMYNFINNEMAKKSDFVATIELIKSERGKIATLFADIFEK